jgi:hypothetical protein
MFERMFDVAQWSDPTGMSASAAAERFAELEALRRRVDAALVALVGEVQRSGVYGADGHKSVSGWVRALGRWSNAEAAQHRQVADLAAASDEFAAALAAGDVGIAQAVELGRAFANPRCGRDLISDVRSFLDHADHVDHREFATRVGTWVTVHDPVGAHDDADRAHERREASITVSGGVVRGRFLGGGAAGAAMLEIFERFRAAELDADLAAAGPGDEAGITVLARTEPQRRFDALAAVFERAAATDPDATTPAPLVNITIDAHTLGELLHDGRNPFETRLDPWLRRCHTSDGTPLAPTEVVGALWWGRVRAVLVDRSGVVLRLGRTHRLFRGRARDAALMAADRCVWPGCDEPAGRCQADHVHEHHAGGATDTDNAAPLCGRHNRFKHRRAYRIQRDPEGDWHTLRPDGTSIR